MLLRIKLLILCLLVILLSSCGYVWQRSSMPIQNSVLGDGSKTIKIVSVEQQSMYAWLGAYVRSIVRDEVTLRQLAVWQDDDEADFEMLINVPSFRVGSFLLDSTDSTLLYTASTSIEFTIRNSKTKTIVWKSGLVSYSEEYENPLEESAIREVVLLALQRAIDKMQASF